MNVQEQAGFHAGKKKCWRSSMKASDWSSCCRPYAMLELLTSRDVRLISDRKLRLFAVACCRQALQNTSADARSIAAVDTAERFADGDATYSKMEEAYNFATKVVSFSISSDRPRLDWDCCVTAHRDAKQAAGGVAQEPHCCDPALQAQILRSIAGDIFHQPLLSPQNATATAIARRIYAERDWAGMAILGDAIEESDCPDVAMLQHCRGFVPCSKTRLVTTDHRCPICGESGRWRNGPHFEHEKICSHPKRTSAAGWMSWEPGETLTLPCDKCNGTWWRRRSASFCRGDWVLDTLLAKV